MGNIPRIDKNDIEFDLLEDFEIEAVENAAKQLLTKVFSNNQGKKELHPDNFWPGLEGYRPDRVNLIIKTLDRVGSEPGFSGTRVFIGNFMEPEKELLSDSLVMKIERTDQKTSKVKDELKEEYEIANWIREQRFEKYDERAFAWPLDIYNANSPDKCSVLWSSFFSFTKPFDLKDPNRANLTQKGLYSVLAGDMAMGWQQQVDDFSNKLDARLQKTYETIEYTYKCLKALHWYGNNSPTVSEKPIVDEYKKYLRGFKEEEWGDTWLKIWEDRKENRKKIVYNPVCILENLESRKFEICVGAIHGDLHPRNIVFSYDRASHIIDFGWASKEAHIAKDFALLECNLRFMMLRPDIPENCLKALVDWVPFHNEFSETRYEYIDGIARIIKKLHQIAKDHFPNISKPEFWTKEYVVPLFLVALGLLKPKVFASCHNRNAAILTVEKLADHIGQEIDAGKL